MGYGDEYGEEETERVKFTYEQLRGGESVLSMQTGTGKFATQKGMTGIGMPRNTRCLDKQMGFIEPNMKGNAFLRSQTGCATGASQKGTRGMGGARNQVALVELKPEWKTKEAKIQARKSEGVNPKLSGDYDMATQSSCAVAIGSRRNNTTPVVGKFARDLRCESAMPFQSGTNRLASQKGMSNPPGTGAYRMQTSGIDYKMSDEMLRASAELTPWYSGQGKFDSQKHTGGFGKVRDVCPHTKGSKAYESDSKLQASHGIVRLQAGTNKLAAQRGMSMGTQRNQKENAPVGKVQLVKQKTEDDATEDKQEDEQEEVEETIQEETAEEEAAEEEAEKEEEEEEEEEEE